MTNLIGYVNENRGITLHYKSIETAFFFFETAFETASI